MEASLETKLDYLIELLESVRSTNKRFLESEEAAEYLGMSKYTLDRYQREGILAVPSIKIGKLVKYDRKELDIYCDSLPRREMKGARHDDRCNCLGDGAHRGTGDIKDSRRAAGKI